MSGCEWLVEAYGCHPDALRDQARLAALFDRLTEVLRLRPVAPPAWHQFPGPGGITGLCLLAESHLACHTFPEYRSLCLNVFCCRPRAEWDFEGYLKREFSADTVRVRAVERPYEDHEPENRELSELRRANTISLV